jgi:hypothetical protein
MVLEQCATSGVSVAKVALSHGMNANVVHRLSLTAVMEPPMFGVMEPVTGG